MDELRANEVMCVVTETANARTISYVDVEARPELTAEDQYEEQDQYREAQTKARVFLVLLTYIRFRLFQ
ncbi:unnamed protein product [Cylicostephanus goldi]|uniref:Uncharacterized protein n=1 Tax=Cylicostephanus goldi TaxID=71465 RepID=A0A3P7R0I3_CYLGO|nr:unnamed protein product [Cylicostephanus goldi]